MLPRVRQEQDTSGARSARARRRCSRGLLDSLELPEPFDLSEFTDQVARRRGRPIQLAPVRGTSADGSPCGWWCPMQDIDVIFLDESASTTYREHIVLHEVGHMLWGHDPVMTTLAPVLEHITSHLRWDSAAIAAMLGRSDYDSPREQEAEVFATVAGLRIAATRGVRPRDVHSEVGRLSQALHPRGRR